MLFYTNCLDLSNLCCLDWTVGPEDARTLSVFPGRLEAPREQELLRSPTKCPLGAQHQLPHMGAGEVFMGYISE